MQRTVKFVAVEKLNMRAVFAVSAGDEKSSPVYSVRRTRDGGRDRTMQKVNRGKNYTCLIIKIDFSPENRRLTYGFMQILSW